MKPELCELLNEWNLAEVTSERSLSPDEMCYKRMSEASSRTWSDYSIKPVPISLALVVLGLTTVDYRICGEDNKRIRFQIANPAYDRRSAIDVIVGTDIYSFLLRDGSQYFEESIVQCIALGWILTRKAKSAMDTPQDQTANYFLIRVIPDLSKEPQKLRELEKFLGRVSSLEKKTTSRSLSRHRASEMVLIVTWCSFYCRKNQAIWTNRVAVRERNPYRWNNDWSIH